MKVIDLAIGDILTHRAHKSYDYVGHKYFICCYKHDMRKDKNYARSGWILSGVYGATESEVREKFLSTDSMFRDVTGLCARDLRRYMKVGGM